jgi:signal transduction histidine kinase
MLRDATLDLLKFSPFSSVAKAIYARIETVMERWLALVKLELPSADHLTLEQLRDELPDILHELAKTLEAVDGSHFESLEEAADEHGELRFHQSYNLKEVLIEYALMRPLLIDEINTELDRHLTAEEVAAISMGIDTAVRRSVIRFSSYQQVQLKVVAEAQSKYLAFLSHDLRGGLNGVLLMVEVLKRELAGEPRFVESIQDLDGMRRSILDTVSTMDRFLHAERFRQGKVQPRNAVVDLRFLLMDLCNQMQHLARAKSLDLQAAVPPGITATTDKDLVLLIMQNLLANAIKYTSKGQVRVVAEKRDGGGFVISVVDHGPGIEDAVMANMFEPFTRGKTHGQDGVGLGLSIAKQAADVIGAQLLVESKVGEGSTFRLELP